MNKRHGDVEAECLDQNSSHRPQHIVATETRKTDKKVLTVIVHIVVDVMGKGHDFCLVKPS